MRKMTLLIFFLLRVCLLPGQQVPRNIDSLFSNGIISMDEYFFYMDRPVRNKLDSFDFRQLNKIKGYNQAIKDKEQEMIDELTLLFKNEEYIFIYNLTDSLMKNAYLNYRILSFLLDNIDLHKNNYQLLGIDLNGNYPIFKSLRSTHAPFIIGFLLSSTYLDRDLRDKQIELLKSFFIGRVESEPDLQKQYISRKENDWTTMKLSNLSKIITEK